MTWEGSALSISGALQNTLRVPVSSLIIPLDAFVAASRALSVLQSLDHRLWYRKIPAGPVCPFPVVAISNASQTPNSSASNASRPFPNGTSSVRHLLSVTYQATPTPTRPSSKRDLGLLGRKDCNGNPSQEVAL